MASFGYRLSSSSIATVPSPKVMVGSLIRGLAW